MIEMRLLEILNAFATEGTQAAAAEKLHISQPTLSGAMKKLEEEIGAPLFERSKNRMSLNENGKAAAEFAGRILQEENALDHSQIIAAELKIQPRQAQAAMQG